MQNGMSIYQGFALVFGVVYLAVGIVGFGVTGFDGFAANTNEALVIFDINPFHNLVHIGIGLFWILASRVSIPNMTLGVSTGIGLIYLLATVLGVAGALEVLSIDGALAPDNFLHLATAVLALIFGRSHDLLRNQAVRPA